VGCATYIEWSTAFQTLRAWLRPCSCLTICFSFLFFFFFLYFLRAVATLCTYVHSIQLEWFLLDSPASTGPSRPPSPQRTAMGISRPAFGHDDRRCSSAFVTQPCTTTAYIFAMIYLGRMRIMIKQKKGTNTALAQLQTARRPSARPVGDLKSSYSLAISSTAPIETAARHSPNAFAFGLNGCSRQERILL